MRDIFVWQGNDRGRCEACGVVQPLAVQERMSDKPWWDTKDFEAVVSLAVTELYQDGRDQLLVEESLQALPTIVADTLRNVHFMEIRDERDANKLTLERHAFNVGRGTAEFREAVELLREAVESVEHDMGQDPVTLYVDVHRPNCFLCRVEAFLKSVE